MIRRPAPGGRLAVLGMAGGRAEAAAAVGSGLLVRAARCGRAAAVPPRLHADSEFKESALSCELHCELRFELRCGCVASCGRGEAKPYPLPSWAGTRARSAVCMMVCAGGMRCAQGAYKSLGFGK